MKTLQEKIDESIALIRKTEPLALALQPEQGFYVGFSGGKDSQVMLELVKMAGVKYRAIHNVTTIDPADNVRFIKKNYPDVEFDIPKESFFKMVEKKGVPTISHRWCCAIFKEAKGVGSVVMTGVRWEESAKRAKYQEISKFTRKKEVRKESIDIDKMIANEFQCIKGGDRFMIYPILKWTKEDIWRFLREKGMPINPCYKNNNRVGCVFCPFAKKKQIIEYCKTHPKLKMAFIHAIERYNERGGKRNKLKTAEDFFECWISHDSIDEYIAKKRQLSIDFNTAQ